ncbi:transcriptional activator hap3 isoform X2 [Cimex lectularius]|uniref:Nuclear transcription factor Y subunit beta n=1 Tax=Cimex lectularius TaxID=79782 RepID=A0A8I6RMH5_CIMLE|nr:transcriptional activator hap3 isoform X2 [Cimex lectularius]
MENTESGDELGTAIFHADPQTFLVQEEMDDDLELAGENTDDSNHGDKPNIVLREQDRFLPIANVAKIMKKAIPESGKIAKDARECVQECVSEFISFITSEASDRCHMEKRKTINGEDILFAMNTLGFDNYLEPLKLYLLKYREAIKGVKVIVGNNFDDVCDDVLRQG